MPKCNLQIFFLSDIVYVLWFLVPSEWPHTKKFHFAFPKYIQNPLSERNVSHNLYRKENVPIITQWFYTTNMSQPHHPTTTKWGHSFVYSHYLTKTLFTLPDISYHSHSSPKCPSAVSEKAPGCCPQPVHWGTSPSSESSYWCLYHSTSTAHDLLNIDKHMI